MLPPWNSTSVSQSQLPVCFGMQNNAAAHSTRLVGPYPHISDPFPIARAYSTSVDPLTHGMTVHIIHCLSKSYYNTTDCANDGMYTELHSRRILLVGLDLQLMLGCFP